MVLRWVLVREEREKKGEKSVHTGVEPFASRYL